MGEPDMEPEQSMRKMISVLIYNVVDEFELSTP